MPRNCLVIGMIWSDMQPSKLELCAELPDEIIHKTRMLKRMQVLEEKGSAFATRPLSSLPVIGELTRWQPLYQALFLETSSMQMCDQGDRHPDLLLSQLQRE